MDRFLVADGAKPAGNRPPSPPNSVDAKWRCRCSPPPSPPFFFPVTFLHGVSKYLFSALALAVALSLFASFTVVPLFCARFIRISTHHGTPSSEQPVTVEHALKKQILTGSILVSATMFS